MTTNTPGPIITAVSGCMECKRWPGQNHAPECVTGQRDELLALLKRIRHAFYVDGTSKALRPVMAETSAAILRAEGK